MSTTSGWREVGDDDEENGPVLLSAVKSLAHKLRPIAAAAANKASKVVDAIVLPTDQEAAKMRHTEASSAHVPSIAPWDTLADQFAILQPELRARVMSIAKSESNFTEEIAQQHTAHHSGNILPGCGPMAQAALDADEVLRDLRYRIVPARLSEESFWRCYFFLVANIKCELLHDWRSANDCRRTAVAEDEAALAPITASDGLSSEYVAAEELDAEFERLVLGP